MAVQFEHTDTFSGEANYSWVNRAYLRAGDSLSDQALVRRAKAWASLTGIRCDVSRYGDTIDIRPRGLCHVVFVFYCDPEHVQGKCLDDDRMPITEHQQGKDPWPSAYRFIGRREGFYVFENEDGKAELFARRTDPPAGWHLRRGKYCFEFCQEGSN